MENRTIRIRVAVICGLLICAVAITTRTMTIAAANQNSYGAHGVYTTAATPTPTATPCASVGSWTEQAPYPIAIWGHAVASVGGNVYGFGGIVNNTAITNAYKYSLASNTWTPVAPLPEPRAWFSGTTDGTYIYLLGGEDQNFNTTATLWRYDSICLQAAPRRHPELTTAGGYLQEATSTSPSAPARLPGTPLPTPGATSRIWRRRAITSQAQLRANPFMPSPAAPPPARVPMTTSSIPKHCAERPHQQLQLVRR